MTQFFVMLCSFPKVNDLRKYLFTKKGRTVDSLPPTEDSLRQHVKRAIFQAGFVWHQALQKNMLLPDPTCWGWQRGKDGYEPSWMKMQDASKICKEVLHCCCKKGCMTRCKCKKADLQCTSLCFCDGKCSS